MIVVVSDCNDIVKAWRIRPSLILFLCVVISITVVCGLSYSQLIKPYRCHTWFEMLFKVLFTNILNPTAFKWNFRMFEHGITNMTSFWMLHVLFVWQKYQKTMPFVPYFIIFNLIFERVTVELLINDHFLAK